MMNSGTGIGAGPDRLLGNDEVRPDFTLKDIWKFSRFDKLGVLDFTMKF